MEGGVGGVLITKKFQGDPPFQYVAALGGNMFPFI